jgi:predicted transport protein
LSSSILALGEDVQVVDLQQYRAFKRIKNLACVGIHPGKGCVTMYLKVDPTTVELKSGFTRDMRNKGHYGNGDLEVVIKSEADLERATTYLRTAYEMA